MQKHRRLVFLFHCSIFFRGGEGYIWFPALYFCYAKIHIISLIYNILTLIIIKRNTNFILKAASWKG